MGVAQITSVLVTAPPPPLTGRPPLGAWPTAAGHLDQQEAAKLADLHASGLREWPKQQLQPPSTALDHPRLVSSITR